MGLCAVASCNSIDASRMCSPFDSAVGSISVMAVGGQGHELDFGGNGCFAWKKGDFEKVCFGLAIGVHSTS